MAEKLGDALLDLRTDDKGLNSGIKSAEGQANKLGATFDSVSARARGVGTAVAGAARVSNDNIQLAGHQLANLQFQLNDIAVGLTSGQSPFVVMSQQGAQIAQLFGPRAGVMAALRAVGQGLVTFVMNPLNLAVVGFGLAATAASALFSLIIDRGSDANGTIEEQEKRIRAVDEALAGAIPALREFIEQKDKLALKDDVARSFETLRNEQLDPLRKSIDDIEVEMSGAIGLMQDMGVENSTISTLQNAFWEAAEAARDGKDGQEEFNRAHEILGDVIERTGNPALLLMQGRLNLVAEQARITAGAIRDLSAAQAELGAEPAAAGVLQRLQEEYEALGKTAEQRRIDQELKKAGVSASSVAGQAIAAEVSQIFSRKAAIEQENSARRAWASAARSAAQRARQETEAQRKAVADLIERLEEELAITRESDPVQREMIALRSVLARATDEQREKVEELIGETLRERQALEEADEAMRAFADLGMGAIDGLIDGGKSLKDVLLGVAGALADMALQSTLLGQGPLAGLLGTSKADGGVGGLFGALGNLFAGGFANGGLIPSGSFGIVGERGPEPVISTSRGAMVRPNSTLGMVAGGGGGSSDTTVRLIMPQGWRSEIVDEARRGAANDTVRIVEEYSAARENLYEGGGEPR